MLRCDALHRRGTVSEAMLYAFDLLELDGEDLRGLPRATARTLASLGKCAAFFFTALATGSSAATAVPGSRPRLCKPVGKRCLQIEHSWEHAGLFRIGALRTPRSYSCAPNYFASPLPC